MLFFLVWLPPPPPPQVLSMCPISVCLSFCPFTLSPLSFPTPTADSSLSQPRFYINAASSFFLSSFFISFFLSLRGVSDAYLMSGISGLSFDSTFTISSLVFLLTPATLFLPAGLFYSLFSRKIFNFFFVKR